MKPPSFEYADPTSLEQAVSLLQEHEFDAKILSGGQSLMPLLNMRLARPGLLIDLAKIPGLDAIAERDDYLVVGAMARQRSLEFSQLVIENHPLIHAATVHIAHPQNRNQGTVGGSLAHADPAAEYPALALALGAELVAVGPDGSRTIAAEDFFETYLTTSLESTEILTEVRFPRLRDSVGWSLQELSRRRGDFALAGVIATIEIGRSGKVENASIVLFGVGSTPVRARGAEQFVVGESPNEKVFASVATRAAGDLEEPLSDVHASAEYRRDLARVLTRRALGEAAARATACASVE